MAYIGYSPTSSSDATQKCSKLTFSKDALNAYEKCSIYTINLAMCIFGYPFSREATIQQIYTLSPTSKVYEWHSRGLFMDKKTQALMAHYPNASKSHPVYLNYGDYSIKNIGEIRCALAANGGKIKKEGYFYVHKCH